MTNIHGKNMVVMVDAFDLTSFCNKVSVDRSVDMAETTAMSLTGAVYKTRLAGDIDGKLSLGGYWDGTATTGIDVRADAQLNGADLVTSIVWGGNTKGNRAALLVIKESDYKTDAQESSAVTFSLNGEVNGSVSNGYLLHALGQETAATNGAGQDMNPVLAAAFTGYIANLQVLEFTGTSITVKLQDATTLGGVYADTTGAVFTAVTAAGAQQITSNTQSVRQFVRVAWTGTFTTCTFLVTMSKKP